MNPQQAKDIIADLIEKHGPDCGETGHYLGINRATRKPVFTHEDSVMEKAESIVFVCKVGKSGMKNGFTTGLWNEMGDALAKAVNAIKK